MIHEKRLQIGMAESSSFPLHREKPVIPQVIGRKRK